MLSNVPQPRGAHTFPIGDTQIHNAPTGAKTPPIPKPWTPRFLPEEWVYTNGSDIKGHPRLGAAVVYIPTRNTLYINATGCDETRTIMRAELAAIHTALTRCANHSWLGVFIDSLSILQAIRLHYYRPGLTIASHYHHHMLLLQSILNLLETRREKMLFHIPLKTQGTHTHPRHRPHTHHTPHTHPRTPQLN